MSVPTQTASADHDLGFGVAGELPVVGGPITAVSHLHDSGLGIGGGNPRLFAGLALFGLDLGHLGQALERPLNALLPLPGGALARCLLAPADRARVVIRLALETLDLLARLLQALFQGRTAAKRGRPGAGAHPNAILGDTPEAHHPLGQEDGDTIGQQGVEGLAMGTAKSREGVVVDRHPAADPAVGVVLLRQARQSACTAHPLQGGIKPQGEQDLRGNGGTPAAAFHRADAGVHGA
jgi:hypothetical protein